MNPITLLRSQKLPAAFYERKNVCTVAKGLLGKILVSNFDNRLTAGRIVETEAYNGPADKASHAWNGRRTSRTEIMYRHGGVAYVYFCYGIHHMFNVVTNVADIPHAVLVRALEPVAGIQSMLARTSKAKADFTLTKGPGNLAKALGIHTSHSGMDLQSDALFIADDGVRIPAAAIAATPRIGVAYAGDDALLPYRFLVKNNPYVSGKKLAD
ncbi:DNA-3-methyladenine glycosylase [Sediminibacterium soli]|uniref:DNA-3-methyladenine glycosylase n=1 Tax=Sediminibacterium soli TaxID=2698829 RepID=UPI0013796A97|nr:DNA-3-methyladenine glycosylase [Sediminibacterium soli]NCI47512.1 DNA-3-methyladenine glycosylase [Sediminibacterium soli]